MVDKHLSDLLTAYDTYILDSSVILTSSSGDFYPGAEAALSLLAEQKKQVIVYDNSPLLPSVYYTDRHWRKWSDKGFGFETSYGLCQRHLQQQGYFSYFLFGRRPLPGLIFMPDMSLAEFIYLDLPGLPQAYLRQDSLIKIPEFPELVFAASVEVFAPFLQQARQQEKVIFCGTPVFTDKILIGNREVVSTKAILDYYRSLGGRVVEFGKPELSSYEAVLNRLPAAGKILCVGHSAEADVRGAVNLCRAGYKAESLLISNKKSAEVDLPAFKSDYIMPTFSLTS